MHELSIALSLIDVATEEAARLDAARVTALHLRLGSRSGVASEALRFSFDLAVAGTAIDGARLVIESTDGAELELRSLEVVDRDPTNR